MRKRSVWIGLLASTVLAMILVGSAFAAPHVTTLSLGGASNTGPWNLSASLTSTGDAGATIGNLFLASSPTTSSIPNWMVWVNQPVTLSNFQLWNPAHTQQATVTAKYYYWGSPVPYTGGELSAEGVYSLTATGTSGADVETGTISWGFGIDRTVPAVTADVKPVYSPAATITITATDTLSGLEAFHYGVKGAPVNFAEQVTTGTLTASVPPAWFAGAGTHQVWWEAIDNAGNVTEGSSAFIVRPANFSPTVSLKVTRVKTSKSKGKTHYHKAKFSGSVSPLASNATLTFSVRKYSSKSKSYKAYKTYKLTIVKYAGSFSTTKSFSSSGKYEVRASFGGGAPTSWKKWTVN